jgi:disulfide oxidoreductase YuzD
VVVSGMASEIPYNGDYKNNEWLAAERARKAKNKINTAREKIPSDIDIIERSSVEGPLYPPNEEMLQEYFPNWDITIDNREKYFDKVEEKIYRDYQKVEISVEYSEITNTGNTDISLDLKRKINNDKIFLMTFDNPWVGKIESNQAKREDQGSIDQQTTKYVKKQMYNGEF